MVIMVSIIKFRGGEINYLDSDATWHTLLTMQAYDETPISQHKFLPIVSLGGVDNKGISWGATIPDKEGNFYYTSFSPAGFVLPYLFIKVFRLPINEKSLYYFNTLLFAISAVLWAFFLKTIYKSEKWRRHIICIGVLTYIFSPELFHGMGIVYWHQSIMQVMLIAQFLTYYQYKTKFIYIKLRNDGTIVELNNDVEEYNLADLTDENWTSGYSNVGNVLLFYYEEELLNNLRNGTFVSTGERQFTIQDIKYDSQWIEVTVEGDASSCKYPAYISIQ